jgi:rare lipoprotein A
VLFVVCGDIAKANTQTMVTSWYGPGLQGNPMANGERFDMNDASVVAHKSLPFGTCLRLVNPANNRSHHVIVQDRGPFIDGRDLDVSKAAAAKLGFIERGVAPLRATQLPSDVCQS